MQEKLEKVLIYCEKKYCSAVLVQWKQLLFLYNMLEHKGKRMEIWISFLFHWSMIEIMHFFLFSNFGFSVSMYLLKILFLFFNSEH